MLYDLFLPMLRLIICFGIFTQANMKVLIFAEGDNLRFFNVMTTTYSGDHLECFNVWGYVIHSLVTNILYNCNRCCII